MAVYEQKLAAWRDRGVRRARATRSTDPSFHKKEFLDRLQEAEERDDLHTRMLKQAAAQDSLLLEDPSKEVARDGGVELPSAEDIRRVEEIFWSQPAVERQRRGMWTSMADTDGDFELASAALDQPTFLKLCALVVRPPAALREHSVQQQRGWLAAFRSIDVAEEGELSRDAVRRFIARRQRHGGGAAAEQTTPVHRRVRLVASKDRRGVEVAAAEAPEAAEATAQRYAQTGSWVLSTLSNAPAKRSASEATHLAVSATAMQARVDDTLAQRRRYETAVDALERGVRTGASLGALFALVHALAPTLFACEHVALWLVREERREEGAAGHAHGDRGSNEGGGGSGGVSCDQGHTDGAAIRGTRARGRDELFCWHRPVETLEELRRGTPVSVGGGRGARGGSSSAVREFVHAVDEFSVAGAAVCLAAQQCIHDPSKDERLGRRVRGSVRNALCVPIFARDASQARRDARTTPGSDGHEATDDASHLAAAPSRHDHHDHHDHHQPHHRHPHAADADHHRHERSRVASCGTSSSAAPAGTSFKRLTASLSSSFKRLRGRGTRAGFELEAVGDSLPRETAGALLGGRSVLGLAAATATADEHALPEPAGVPRDRAHCVGCLELLNKVGDEHEGRAAPQFTHRDVGEANGSVDFVHALGRAIVGAWAIEAQSRQAQAQLGMSWTRATAVASRAKSFRSRRVRGKLRAAVLAHSTVQ